MADGDLRVSRSLVIPADELSEAFVRSGGPGGQNVNKVASKVELRWNATSSRALAAVDRDYLLARIAGRLTTAGDLIVRSSETRDQVRNRADARERLADILRAALERPRPRKATRPTRGSVKRRLEGKKRRAAVKRARRVDD